MATAEGTPPVVVEEVVDKGLKSGALGLLSSVVMGVASTAPAYSLAATLGLIVVAVGLGAPVIALLAFIPMLLDLHRVQRAEQDRPGLRHHVHLGVARVRAEDRLGGRLGDRRRRRAGHGEPGAGRVGVPVPALRRPWHRREPDGRLGAAGRNRVDHRDDVHLLPRHRGVREVPAGAAEHRDRHAAAALGGRARPGRNRASSERLDHAGALLVQPAAERASRRSSAASS